MPGVETGLIAVASAPENARHDPADSFSGRPAKGDEFDQAMKNALASSNPKSTPGRIPPRPNKNLPGTTKSSPAQIQTADAASESDAGVAVVQKNPGNQTAETVAGKKAEAPDEKVSADSNCLPAAEAEKSWSGFFPLSLNSYFWNAPDTPGENSSTGKIGTPEEILPVPNLPTVPGIIAPPRSASADPAATAALKPAMLDLIQGLKRPVAQAEDSSAVLGPAADKAAPSIAAKPDASGNAASALTAAKNDFVAELAVKPDGQETLVAAQDSKALPEPTVAGQKSELDHATAIENAAENAGTGVATMTSPMKNTKNTNKVAGPDVKVLPVGENGAGREKNLPSPLLVTPVRADNGGADLNFSFSSGNSQTAVVENAPTLNVLDLPSLADARMRAVERTHDMMALHAMRLVESKSDTLSVVIKPAVGTELSLELRQRNGGVEAQATLTRGDHQFLSQHWPELQQRMELRGIKLAPLGGGEGFSANDNRHFQQQQTSQEEAAQQASAFAEFASIRSGGASARLAVVHDGWESWA